jgi:hypothetical protein
MSLVPASLQLKTDGLERESPVPRKIGIANLSGFIYWLPLTCSIEIPANCDTVHILRWYDLYLIAGLLTIAHSYE